MEPEIKLEPEAKTEKWKKPLAICIGVILGLALLTGVVIGIVNLLNPGTTETQVVVSGEKIYVNLDNLAYSTDQNNYTNLTEYQTLDDYLNASGNLPAVYITDFLYDGISTVKTPDLDDFIDAGSNDTKIKDLEIKVININMVGDVEFTGEATGVMIGVNTNNVSGEINLILNNASINTDSKKAPVVYVYNKDRNYTDAKVTIKTVAGTKNYLEGGKLKKVSLVGSDELSKYTNYYSGTALTNYKEYTNYYGIYTSDKISNVLFATVTADNEDLQDGDPYYFYKAAGAVSSDIDLYFEGEGYLKITSKKGEGVETKGNLNLIGGTGDYEIFALDDCLNTTTASGNGTVRNDMVINVNSLLAQVMDDGDEGDAIDSNGTLTINGGTIYAFAHSESQDAGLDSATGTYINGGTVIATGNMVDAISDESKQEVFYVSFNSQIPANTVVTIKDSDGKVVASFTTEKNIKNLLYSSPELKSGASYKIYAGDTEVSFSEAGAGQPGGPGGPGGQAPGGRF